MKIEKIIEIVCKDFESYPGVIWIVTRARNVVQIRQICHYFAVQLNPKMSYKTIGEEIGLKDHATVIHSCKTVKNLMQTDKEYRIMLMRIESKLLAQVKIVYPTFTMSTYQERKQLILN